MKVALDAQLAVGTPTGIGEYVRGLVPALRQRGLEVDELCEPRLDPWRFDRRIVWDQFILPQRARRSGAQVLHCASGTMPLRAPLPVVATVHDVAWLRVQDHARAYARWYFGRFSLARYARAAAILCDSEFSRRELLDASGQLVPERVHVAYPGVARAFCELARTPDRRTILVVGTVERRKNLAWIVDLLAELPQARIVSVGPFTPYARECLGRARALGVEERVELRGYVGPDELVELYERAAVAAVPSVYEGFGYAVAQALCAGLPCVASDRTSLPEVACGDATILPLGERVAWRNALADALMGALDEHASAVRARSVERFSWSRAADVVARAYRDTV